MKKEEEQSNERTLRAMKDRRIERLGGLGM